MKDEDALLHRAIALANHAEQQTNKKTGFINYKTKTKTTWRH